MLFKKISLFTQEVTCVSCVLPFNLHLLSSFLQSLLRGINQQHSVFNKMAVKVELTLFRTPLKSPLSFQAFFVLYPLLLKI